MKPGKETYSAKKFKATKPLLKMLYSLHSLIPSTLFSQLSNPNFPAAFSLERRTGGLGFVCKKLTWECHKDPNSFAP